MKLSTQTKRIIRAFTPLAFMLVSSTFAYAFVYDYTLSEVFASGSTFNTLIPGFLFMLFSIIDIKCRTTKMILVLMTLTCVFIILYRIAYEPSLMLNTTMSVIYILLGSYIGYIVLADARCSNCEDKTPPK